MDMKPNFKHTAELLKVLGQETRLKILEQLREGPRFVGEFCPDCGEQSNISRHLAVLKGAGVVDDHRDGNRQYYQVVMPEVFTLVDAARRLKN